MQVKTAAALVAEMFQARSKLYTSKTCKTVTLSSVSQGIVKKESRLPVKRAERSRCFPHSVERPQRAELFLCPLSCHLILLALLPRKT